MCGVLSDSSLFYICQVIALVNSCQNKFGLFCQFTWRKKSVGNAFYFSITKICEPYKKIHFIFVFKIKYSLTNGQPTWNVSKDWFFNYLIIQYEQNSYIHLWRGYVCTRKFTIKNRIWSFCCKKTSLFFYSKGPFFIISWGIVIILT